MKNMMMRAVVSRCWASMSAGQKVNFTKWVEQSAATKPVEQAETKDAQAQEQKAD